MISTLPQTSSRFLCWLKVGEFELMSVKVKFLAESGPSQV
jgi:hypothetical protein